jgi:hypothetical protein
VDEGGREAGCRMQDEARAPVADVGVLPLKLKQLYEIKPNSV